MTLARRSAWRNPSTWYFVTGLVMLGSSMAMPYLTARRTTRVEDRAERVSEALLRVTDGFAQPLDAADVEILLARFYRLAGCRRIRTVDLERIPDETPGVLLLLHDKHYLYQLAVSPPDARERPGRHSIPAYEVLAWPRSALGPGHSVFFCPQNAMPAFTRNLARGYAGLDRRPLPGTTHRRQQLWTWTTSYYGIDDERWMTLPPRPGA